MWTRKLICTLSVALLAVACSSAEPVEDQSPMEAEMEDYGDEYAFDMDEGDDEIDEADEGDEAVREALRIAADGEHRSQEDRHRNQYRNPVETLLFFGFEPDLEVVELWPGRGWYTGVLAPATSADTALRVALFGVDEDDPEDYRTRITAEYLEWLQETSETLGRIERRLLDPPEAIDLGESESADLVVTFRNLHNMYNNDSLDAVISAVYEVLKPGGTFGVVQHRAPEGTNPDETAPQGYLSQQFVIDTIEAAGFVLEKTSEINANPRDTADHEHGVWSLPPSLRGGEEDAQRYLEIGESDRMTLRFVKPDEGDGEAAEDGDSEDGEEG